MFLKAFSLAALLLPSAFASPVPASSAKKVQYYALSLPTQPILSAVSNTFSAHPDSASFYQQLQSSHRIQKSFHVTLIHTADRRGNEDVWSYYQSGKADGVSADVALKQIVWDGRLMAISIVAKGDNGVDLPSADKEMHITVGTVDGSVKPVESNDLLERWRAGGDDASDIRSLDVEGSVKSARGTVTVF